MKISLYYFARLWSIQFCTIGAFNSVEMWPIFLSIPLLLFFFIDVFQNNSHKFQKYISNTFRDNQCNYKKKHLKRINKKLKYTEVFVFCLQFSTITLINFFKRFFEEYLDITKNNKAHVIAGNFNINICQQNDISHNFLNNLSEKEL